MSPDLIDKLRYVLVYGFYCGYSNDAILNFLKVRANGREFVDEYMDKHPNRFQFEDTGFVPTKEELDKGFVTVSKEINERRVFDSTFPNDDDDDEYYPGKEVGTDIYMRWLSLLIQVKGTPFAVILENSALDNVFIRIK